MSGRLTIPPARPSTPRWIGTHVIWWGGEDWEFANCVRCGEPLRSKRSVANGYGPGCAQYVTKSLVQATLAKERDACRASLARNDPALRRDRIRTARAVSRRRARRSTTPPSAKQLGFLRNLCMKTGITFVRPKTRQEASDQIGFLLRQPK